MGTVWGVGMAGSGKLGTSGWGSWVAVRTAGLGHGDSSWMGGGLGVAMGTARVGLCGAHLDGRALGWWGEQPEGL